MNSFAYLNFKMVQIFANLNINFINYSLLVVYNEYKGLIGGQIYMTAEIGILNKQGVVLAADSAVTIGGGKVYNSASKLFTLSANHSIGFMVYGDAEFVGIPWEVLIKKFSLEVGNTPLDTIENYVSSFFSFLNEKKIYFVPKFLKSMSMFIL